MRSIRASTLLAGELAGRVVAIADGDTITVLVSRQQIKVRLLDIAVALEWRPVTAHALRPAPRGAQRSAIGGESGNVGLGV